MGMCELYLYRGCVNGGRAARRYTKCIVRCESYVYYYYYYYTLGRGGLIWAEVVWRVKPEILPFFT